MNLELPSFAGRSERKLGAALIRLRLLSQEAMSLKAVPKLAAATVALLAAAPQAGFAQPPVASAKTQAEAAAATGKPTSDAPAKTRAQGTAWAVQQGAAQAAAATPAAPAKVVERGNIVETLRGSGQFTTFLKAADATNLTGVLRDNQNLTVFVPTDAAFAALPPGRLDQLMADKTQLQKLLTHHIINARVDSSKIKGARGPVASVAGDQIMLDGSGEALRADGATILQADIAASNGLVHVVDAVLSAGPGSAGKP